MTVCGRDEDRATRVSSLTNEEPLMVVEACVDVVWEVIRKNRGYGCNGVIWKQETSLGHGGRGSVLKRASSVENGDIGRDWSDGGHQGSEVFVSGGGDKNIIGVDGDVLVVWGKQEGVKDFLSYLGGSGRHCWWTRSVTIALL